MNIRLFLAMAVLLLVSALAHTAQAARPHTLKLSQCPPAVQKTLLTEAKGAKIADVALDSEDGELEYTAKVVIKQRHYSITVEATGKLIEKLLDNEEEKEIRFDDCPRAVRRAFIDETDGAKIETVEKDTQNGVVWYSADVQIGGEWYLVTVAENGVLVEKSLEDDPDDTDTTVKLHQVEHSTGGSAQFQQFHLLVI